MSILKLPTEVFQLTLEQQSRQQMYQCMFVCMAWSSVAYEEFHKVLDLTGKVVDIIRPLLLERCFDQWFQGGRFVKELKIRCSAAADSQECLRRIQRISVQDMMGPRYGVQPNQSYFEICYKLRQRLFYLTINDATGNASFTFDGISRDYIHFLPQFSQLTNLTINVVDRASRENSKSDKINAYVLPFFTVLNVCQSLVYLKYESDYSLPADETLSTILPTTMDRYNNNATKLKKLELSIPGLTSPYMEYLTQKHVTNQLQEFILTTNYHGINFNDWIHNEYKSRILIKFAESLQSIPHLSISPKWQNLISKGTTVMQSMPTGLPSTSGDLELVRLYWKLVNAIKGSRELNCDVRFVVPQISLFNRATDFVLNIKDNRNMGLCYKSSSMDCLFPDESSNPQLDLLSDIETAATSGGTRASLLMWFKICIWLS